MPWNLHVSSRDCQETKGNGGNFDARILQWKEEAEKEKATVSVEVEECAESSPCNSTAGASMEVVEIAKPASFKHYRYKRDVYIR